MPQTGAAGAMQPTHSNMSERGQRPKKYLSWCTHPFETKSLYPSNWRGKQTGFFALEGDFSWVWMLWVKQQQKNQTKQVINHLTLV